MVMGEIELARRLFVQRKQPGPVVERAALAGGYDDGDWIKDLLTEARLLIAMEEDVPE
jgi:hypothetical protein